MADPSGCLCLEQGFSEGVSDPELAQMCCAKVAPGMQPCPCSGLQRAVRPWRAAGLSWFNPDFTSNVFFHCVVPQLTLLSHFEGQAQPFTHCTETNAIFSP